MLSDTTAPYAATWDATSATAGAHTITATAYDAAGNTTVSSVSVTDRPDTTAPTVSHHRAGRRRHGLGLGRARRHGL